MNFLIEKTKFVSELDYSNEIMIPSYNKDYNVHYLDCNMTSIINKIYNENDFIFIDENVYNLYGKLDFISNEYYHIFKATEETKTMDSVICLVERLMRVNLTKKNKLIVIGGGITQDVGGFAATIYKRGIHWVLIPTTLLSMADSAIGGKVCINHGCKNILSIFNSPNDIYLSNIFLSTLSEMDIYSGLGEICKLCLIGGITTYSLFIEYIQYNNILLKNNQVCKKNIEFRSDFQERSGWKSDIIPLIKIASCIKKQIIICDEFDRKERKVLNYGHTFGHAIEKTTNYKIPHGIAVSYGMYIINRIFYSEKYDEINRTILDLIPIPQEITGQKMKISIHEFIECVISDKKNDGNRICFIVLDDIGKTSIQYKTIDEIYEKLLDIMNLLFTIVT